MGKTHSPDGDQTLEQRLALLELHRGIALKPTLTMKKLHVISTLPVQDARQRAEGHFRALCACTIKTIFDAAKCSAYAARCGVIATGSAPCPCRLVRLLMVGRPDSMAARSPAKWLSNSDGINPFLNSVSIKGFAVAFGSWCQLRVLQMAFIVLSNDFRASATDSLSRP